MALHSDHEIQYIAPGTPLSVIKLMKKHDALMHYSQNIARPDTSRCLVAIFLPVILLVPALLINYASGSSINQYYDRLGHTPPLMAKAVMNGSLGLIGLALWGYLMLPPALLALYHRNEFLAVANGNLIFLGREICKISDISDAILKESGMKKNLFIINIDNKTISVGNIAMSQDAEAAVDEVRNCRDRCKEP